MRTSICRLISLFIYTQTYGGGGEQYSVLLNYIAIEESVTLKIVAAEDDCSCQLYSRNYCSNELNI